MEEENKEIHESEPKRRSLLRRVIRAILYVVLGFFVLNALLYLALSVPYIQQKLVNFASGHLSTMLKTEVQIREVRFDLFSHAYIKGLYIEDQAKDTLLYADFLDAKLKPWDILKHNRVKVKHVLLDDFYINLNKKDSLSDYNFQFIIDEFSSSDSTKVDTTSSSAIAIIVDDIQITNGRLRHKLESDSVTPHLFNASDIYVTDFNAFLSVKSVDIKDLDVTVNSITARDQSGFEISNIQGHILSKESLIWIDDLELTLPKSHLKTRSVYYDLESDNFEIITDDTEISPEDVTPFYSNLKFLKHKLSLNTTIRGTLPLVDLEMLRLAYGQDAVLEGSAFISSYEDWGNANISVDITKLGVSPRGLTDLIRLGDSTFIAPSILDTLGTSTLVAKLKGKLSRFDLNSKLTTQNGSLDLNAQGGSDTTFTVFDVKAKLGTSDFNLRPFTGKDSGLGNLAMHLDLDASQKGENKLEAKLKGAIDSLQINHGSIRSLPFAGYFNPQKMGFGADANLKIGRIMAGFEMSMAAKPDISFGLSVANLDVAHFYKNKLWDSPSLSFKLKGDIKKLDIDDLNADISLKDIVFVDSTFNYRPRSIDLKAWKDESAVKHISLVSSIMSFNLKGQYKFSTLADEFSGLMNDYLSNVFEPNKKKIVSANDFVFDITLHNSEELGYIFDLPVDVIEPLVIDGIVNTPNKTIDVVGLLPLARNASMDIKNVKLNIANMDSAFNIKLNTSLITPESSYELALKVNGSDNSMRSVFSVLSDSIGAKVDGKIDALAQFIKGEKNELISFFQIVPSDISIGNLTMNILPAKILNKDDRTEINNLGIGINRKKYLDVNGFVSKNSSDTLKLHFNHAHIEDVLQGLNIKNIHACVHGNVNITNVLQVPEVYTKDFEIADIILFNDTLGTVAVDTRWSSELGGIQLSSTLKKGDNLHASIDGLIDTNKETLDIHMDIERFSVNWLKPFMTGLLNDISGDISSHLTVKGTFDEPVTEGFLGFNNTKIGVDYTNVTYNIADTIDIESNRIGFDNLVIKDNQGNKATVSARVTHRNYKDMKYSLDMRLQNFMVLNTVSRTDSLFYGRLFASGTVKINGSDKGIDMNMQLKNDKNSLLNVTIPQTTEATDYQSVVYINVPEDKLPKKDKRKREYERVKEEDIPIRIKMKLDVNSGIALGVVIDPETGDKMQVKGNGTINFTYDMATEDMKVYGAYTTTEGSVRLNLQNVSKLEFKIRENSKLEFIGDPLKTKFNIIAYRRVKADLRTLDQSFEMENSSPRVQVDCLLGINGNMDKMDLSYDVELYNSSDDLSRKMKSIINTDDQRIKQFAYLIASGTFHSNTNSSGANFTDGMWTNLASSTLSNGLNSVFGSILGDKWEIGTDISSNDGTFSDMDMSVNASTRLFDDKLKLYANVGYRSEGAASTDDSFIGDFDAEYQLNSTWMLKAYSHTNDRFYRQAPTTQGVGIVFTREAATIKRLFKSFKRRRTQWREREKIENDEAKEERKARREHEQGKGEKQPAAAIDEKDITPLSDNEKSE